MRKRCLARGCTTLITRGSYCAEHRPYGKGWRDLSAGILRRDDYQCQCGGCASCLGDLNPTCVRDATTTDHINGDPNDNQPSNLRAMCRPCNTVKGGLA